jgi:hypothetical protein
VSNAKIHGVWAWRTQRLRPLGRRQRRQQGAVDWEGVRSIASAHGGERERLADLDLLPAASCQQVNLPHLNHTLA